MSRGAEEHRVRVYAEYTRLKFKWMGMKPGEEEEECKDKEEDDEERRVQFSSR